MELHLNKAGKIFEIWALVRLKWSSMSFQNLTGNIMSTNRVPYNKCLQLTRFPLPPFGRPLQAVN